MATHLQGTKPVIPTVTPHPLAGSLRKVEPRRLSLSLLIALVVGSMIGSGIFSLPQNMAASAGAGAILIGWLITGVGMLAGPGLPDTLQPPTGTGQRCVRLRPCPGR